MTNTIELAPAGERPEPGAAKPPDQAKKARLLRKAIALSQESGGRESSDPVEAATAEQVIGLFYQHVAPADVAGRSPRDLAGAALALFRFVGRRRPGQAKIRVYNPEPAADGWSSPHTIVEIGNDDMPFLVDSATAAINASDRVVHLVIHPIVDAERDPSGRLRQIREPDAAGPSDSPGLREPTGLRKSWMQIEITREPDPANLARLTQTMASVLADVRVAVGDWQPMRHTLRALLDELPGPPQPPVPQAELAETQDFLRWLDDDNFTFLGYREYDFAGAAEPARPALGILRDRDYPIFGGLRDLSSLPPDVRDFLRRRELLDRHQIEPARSTVHRTAHMDAIGVRRFGAGGEVVGHPAVSRAVHLARLQPQPALDPAAAAQGAPYRRPRRAVARRAMTARRLLHILDTFPRDELFQAHEDELFDTAIGILNLQERQRIALFVRRDPLDALSPASSMCRASATTPTLRRRFAAILEKAFAGRLSAFYTHLDDSVLARIHFIIRTTRGRGAGGRCRGARAAIGRGRAQLVRPASGGGRGANSARPRRRSGCAG